MASLIDDLNDLLVRMRSGLEAAQMAADGIEITDPDVEKGLEDIIQCERWSCSGLYHRITQLDGTPTLLATDLAARVAEENDLQGRLRAICRDQRSTARQAGAVLGQVGLDEATSQLLVEIRDLHLRNAAWCKQKLTEWEPEGRW